MKRTDTPSKAIHVIISDKAVKRTKELAGPIAALALMLAASFGCTASNPDSTLVKKKCSNCHTTKRVFQARKNEGEWKKTIERMVRHGAQLSEEEKTRIIRYLADR